jgi:hypothetical protein
VRNFLSDLVEGCGPPLFIAAVFILVGALLVETDNFTTDPQVTARVVGVSAETSYTNPQPLTVYQLELDGRFSDYSYLLPEIWVPAAQQLTPGQRITLSYQTLGNARWVIGWTLRDVETETLTSP